MAASRTAGMRWLFVVLTFAITTIGYADRQVVALLKPALDLRFGWSPQDYGLMTTAFQLTIAFSLLGAGWFLDRVGLRWGFAIGLGGWSAAACAHAVAKTVGQFVAARAALGACESVGTPAGMKSVAAFFPSGDRALIIGLLNVAPSLATIIAPIAITQLFMAFGWEATVLSLGGVGFFCVALWLALPLRRMELAGEHAVEPVVDHTPVLREKPVWALAVAKLLTDQAWWFFLFWLPDFLHRRFALNISHIAAPVALIYAMAAAGSLAGGALPRVLVRRGLSAGRARSAALLGFAFGVSPILLILLQPPLWTSALIVGFALAAHQGFSTNVFALSADLFLASRIGRVIGFAAFLGNVGGAISAHAAGWCLENFGTLAPMFVTCALGYPLAWLVLREGAFPRLETRK